MKELSKFLSLILRHKPEIVGLVLDKNGYVFVSDLVSAVCKVGKPLNREMLEHIVETNDKKRFAFNEDGTKIRASQGHSIGIDLGLNPMEPPCKLYHGTTKRFVSKIMEEGIVSKSRDFVHLSDNVETATSVGRRHGEPVVLEIDSESMFCEGYDFYISENKVWLVKFVPTQFVKPLWHNNKESK